MGNRFYLPALGRFTTRDVLFGEPTSPVSLNQFTYGNLNPVTMVDPTGMRPDCTEYCSNDEEQDLTETWSNNQEEYGTYGNQGTVAPPPAPAPAPTPTPQSVVDLSCRVKCPAGIGPLGDRRYTGPEGERITPGKEGQTRVDVLNDLLLRSFDHQEV